MAFNISGLGGALNTVSNVASTVAKVAQGVQTGVADLQKLVASFSNQQPGSNAAKNNPMAKMPSTAELFGTGDPFAADNKKKQEAAKNAAVAGGASGGGMSLGALLAMVGSLLVKSMNTTMDNLAAAAKTLDATTTKGGPTAEQNQKIQEMTFNLQQIQQTLNRVNETVTNLSKSQTEAQKSTIQNLSV